MDLFAIKTNINLIFSKVEIPILLDINLIKYIYENCKKKIIINNSLLYFRDFEIYDNVEKLYEMNLNNCFIIIDRRIKHCTNYLNSLIKNNYVFLISNLPTKKDYVNYNIILTEKTIYEKYENIFFSNLDIEKKRLNYFITPSIIDEYVINSNFHINNNFVIYSDKLKKLFRLEDLIFNKNINLQYRKNKFKLSI